MTVVLVGKDAHPTTTISIQKDATMEKEILQTQNRIPLIYAYSDEHFSGCLKVGYTERETAEERIREQFIHQPKQTWQIVLQEKAIKKNGEFFKDHAVHRVLEKHGFKRIRDENGTLTEWFECTLKDVQAALLEVKTGVENTERKIHNFPMRPEQQEAVEKTAAYFADMKRTSPNKTPHFLWNAKMRFGKTFSAYQLAKKQGWKKMLILTFKPAVQNAWEEDLRNHIDFENWQFIRAKERDAGKQYNNADKNYPIVAFASFQDFLGKGIAGSLKIKNEWAHSINWDCVIFDEYHFGAWRENAHDLFAMDNDDLSNEEKDFDEDILPITANHYLYLSGTPFRAIATGEFVEEQIYNWTYADEQKAKKEWVGDNNPYEDLPQMVMLTYRLPENISHIAETGEFNEFDLNEFFRATQPQEHRRDEAQFVHKEEVQKWLQFIQNRLPESIVDNLKRKTEKPAFPFSDVRLLSALNHTFWFLPDVASCYAMRNLLQQKQNSFFKDYEIIVCAGTEAGIGVEALKPVQNAMKNHEKTITLSCGKLTTGITVKEWGGIFMLRNASSPETYFQAAFRVQSPFVLRNSSGEKLIVKQQCFVFDFAPNRALRCVSEYSGRLNNNEAQNAEQKVAEFIQFLPILAYDGASMKEIDATGVLDFALSGTTATLLARKWESALLVNVDNKTLQGLLDNDDAIQILENIEGFRSLREDIQTIINQSNHINKTKRENPSSKEKRELTEQEKELKSKRKQVQEKLIKFATRIPIFMYLSEWREETLHDVITKLEPELFFKVTGITQDDFGLLKSLNVFNESLMNEAVFQFKRYEDASLEYTGINRYENDLMVGGYNTQMSVKDFR